MRNKNIYIRNETAYSCLVGNELPVFACVTGYFEEDGKIMVMYKVDYAVMQRRRMRWHYASNTRPIHDTDFVVRDSGTYILSYEEFRKKFRPDVFNWYEGVDKEVQCAA